MTGRYALHREDDPAAEMSVIRRAAPCQSRRRRSSVPLPLAGLRGCGARLRGCWLRILHSNFGGQARFLRAAGAERHIIAAFRAHHLRTLSHFRGPSANGTQSPLVRWTTVFLCAFRFSPRRISDDFFFRAHVVEGALRIDRDCSAEKDLFLFSQKMTHLGC